MSLPVVRSHERMDFKRCPKKWYWKWRRGLVPKAVTFGPLDLGTWMHYALEHWYAKGRKRDGTLQFHFTAIADYSITVARNKAPEHVLIQADELAVLGENMCTAYSKKYGRDPEVNVLGAEIPLEFSIPDYRGKVIAVHKLKPDLVYADKAGDVWLMEHKTAKQIRTDHLPIDDQARPYGAMAERSLRRAGVIGKRDFRGIMYNFIRKALPDERQTDEQGRALNKDGTVSRRQPANMFLRHPVTLTAEAKRMTLLRTQQEAIMLTGVTTALRTGRLDPANLTKTPHGSCAKTCQFFAMCVAEENGSAVRDMERLMFVRSDPYAYGETTDEPIGFEMG